MEKSVVKLVMLLGSLSFLAVTLGLPAAAAEAPLTQTEKLEIRHYPGDFAIELGIKGAGTPASINSVILHNIAVVNSNGSPTEIASLLLSLSRDGEVFQTSIITAEDVASAARKWSERQSKGVLEAYDPILRTSRFIPGVILAQTPLLGPGEGLLLTQLPLVYQGKADQVLISARSSDEKILAQRTVLIVKYENANTYRFPLSGRWFVAAGPNLHSHHRWAPIQEFAFDIVKLRGDANSHSDNGTRAKDYFAFGAPVYAAADGIVAATANEFDDDVSLRRTGESDEEYRAREGAYQAEMLGRGISALIGNHVIIDHGNGEFGYYAHLAKDSVLVSVGERVTAGQEIGAVGNSGNSTQPHLHFHLSDGPDAASSRSLPIRFSNITVFDDLDGGSGIINSGFIVESMP